MQGTNAHIGVSGSGSYIGVYGDATTTGSYGVFGLAGMSYGNGVLGISQSGNTNTYGIGVRGLGYGPVNTGVYGYGTALGVNAQSSGTGTALNAAAAGGPAVNAASSAYHGILATTSAANYAAVFGYAGTAGAIGVEGEATSPNAYAAAFIGSTVVNGAFVVYTGPKSAAVPHPDGSYRLLYCVESPDSWFEDFGEGTLTAGKADVKLDADFAAVVDTSAMHVFFTETDGHHALYLTGKSASGFTVVADAEALAARGKKATDVNGRFSYRVVAKRKDLNATRLAKVPAPLAPQKVTAAEYSGAPPLPKVPAGPPPAPPLHDSEKKG